MGGRFGRNYQKIYGPNGLVADIIATNGHNGIVAIAPGHISTKNSTTDVLLAGIDFTGDWEDVTNFGVLIVTLTSDVGSAVDGLMIQFSSDGTVSGIISDDDVYTISAGAKKTFSFQTAAKYYRVKYTNGASPQSSFNLQAILKPYYVKPSSHRIQDMIIADDDAELIKAVITGKNPAGNFINFEATTKGNFKSSIEEFENLISVNSNTQLRVTPFDISGKEINTPITAFGDLRVTELHPQFQGSFEYTVDNTDLNINTEINGGTVTQASGMAILSTSVTTASVAMLESARQARYKAGLGGVSRFTVLYSEPVADTEQYIGLVDEEGSAEAFKNGMVIGYTGLTFGYHRFQNDSKITIPLSTWDDPLDGSGLSGATLTGTNLNVFFIQYQYLGAGAIKIFFEKEGGDIVLVHIEKYAGKFTEPSTHNPNYHFIIYANNKDTTSDLVIKSSSYAYFVEGKTQFIELHQPQNASGLKEKTAVTSETAILTIRNKATYVSKTNFIDIHIQAFTVSIEASAANNLADIRVIKNTSLGGTPAYSDINTSNSVVEIDVAGTTVTGGVEIYTIPLAGKNDREIPPDVDIKRILLAPGEILTIAGSSANAATIRAAIQWRELF